MHLYVVDEQALRAARANRVFCADEKRIRAENAVMVNTKQGAGVSSAQLAQRRNNGGAIYVAA
jgi:hypothetical protein